MIDKNEELKYENYDYQSIIIELLGDRKYDIKDGELRCTCPFHEDTHPSFGLNISTGLFNCFSCGEKGNLVQFVSKMKDISIVEAIDYLHSKGYDIDRYNKEYYYTLETYAHEKHLDVNILRDKLHMETAEDGKSIEIPYYNQEGVCIAKRHRNSPKSSNRFWWSENSKSNLYGLHNLDKVSEKYVILVEGESDCHCCWANDIVAIGVPGCKNFKKEYAPLFDKFEKIYIHQEPDEGGTQFVKKICQCMPRPNRLYTVSAFDVDNECKDLADLHIKGKLELDTLLSKAQKVPLIYLKEINTLSDIAPHIDIAEKVLEKIDVKFYANDFYIYKENCYKKDTVLLEQTILNVDNNLLTRERKEVTNYLKIRNAVVDNEVDDRYINFLNGRYDLKDRKLLDPTPDVFTINCLSVNYIPDYKMTTNIDVDNFLDVITCKDTNKKIGILQSLGYTLTYRTDLEKSIWLYSNRGGTGKSTLLTIIEHIVGDDNTCSISLKKYSERFASSAIVGKLLNSVHETPKKAIKDIETFKASVSGNMVNLEKKGLDVFDYKPYVKNWFAMNKLPNIEPDIIDDGFFRRLFIIDFQAEITQEDINNFDLNKLLSQEALDYLANIALREYLKMLDNYTKVFSYQEESNKLVDMYKAMLCPDDEDDEGTVIKFLTEFKLKNQGEVSQYQLYKKYYLSWCNKNNIINILPKSKFYKIVLETGIFKVTEHQHNKYFTQV